MGIEVPDIAWTAALAIMGFGGSFFGFFRWQSALFAKEATARHALADKTQSTFMAHATEQRTALAALDKSLDRVFDEYAKKSELRETETRIMAAIAEIKSDMKSLSKDVIQLSDRMSTNMSTLGEKISGLVAIMNSRNKGSISEDGD